MSANLSEEEIRRLVENCILEDPNCIACPFGLEGKCRKSLLKEVYRLLQNDAIAREARIISLEAFLYGDCNPFKHGCVWLELRPCGLAPAFFDCTHGKDIRFLSLYLTADGNHTAWMSGEYYGKTWRCWTAKPTDKQMEDTKWNE